MTVLLLPAPPFEDCSSEEECRCSVDGGTVVAVVDSETCDRCLIRDGQKVGS